MSKASLLKEAPPPEYVGLDAARERANFRAELMQRIDQLDLVKNCYELETLGYTVIRDAASLSFIEELRAQVLEVTKARLARGETVGDRRGLFSYINKNTLSKGRVFEQTVMNPKVNAIAAFLLGDGYILNTQSASVVSQGTPPLFLHSDNAYVPEPFPPWPVTATFVWVTEDLTPETGASRVVPGSHKYNRQPYAGGEGEQDAVPIICPKGSVQVWNGATWHGNCGRTAPGERVTVHTSFARMCFRTFSNNDAVPEEVVARNPGLDKILGRDLPYFKEFDNGSDPALFKNGHLRFARRLQG